MNISWFKEISVVLIIGSVAVLAGTKKTSEGAPRIISEQDFRLFFNPLNFLYVKPTTTPQPQRPTSINPPYPYPNYPHYPHYPPFPHYPHYPHYPHFLPYPPPPTQPTSTTIQPTEASKPTKRPSKRPPSKRPQAAKYPPPPPFVPPPFNYHPWYFPPQVNGAPYIVFISPSGPGNSNDSGNSNNKDKDKNKENKDDGEGNKVDSNMSDGNKDGGNKDDADKNDSNKSGKNNNGTGNKGKGVGDLKDSRFIPPNPFFPYIENAKIIETFQAPEFIADDEQANFDYESEAAGRSTKGTSISAESEENNDSLTVNTNDIKLPFGIQFSSFSTATPSPSNKTVTAQEALIYLKNLKKGRQLEAIETA